MKDSTIKKNNNTDVLGKSKLQYFVHVLLLVLEMTSRFNVLRRVALVPKNVFRTWAFSLTLLHA